MNHWIHIIEIFLGGRDRCSLLNTCTQIQLVDTNFKNNLE